MRIQVATSYEQMSRQAAARIAREVRRKPGLLLGAVTGATPTRTYERLASLRAAEPSRFRRLRVLKLDEWMGIPMSHPASCESYLRERLLQPLGIPRSRYEGFRSGAPTPRRECARLARWLGRHGPLDLCLLGLGRNGHLLMNEPAPDLPPGPHVARLSESTRRHSMLDGVRPSPRFGLTMGLGDILQARTVLLLVSGKAKSAALRRLLAGRVTTRYPVSFLLLHPDVTVYCDRAAGRALGGRGR